MISDVNTLSIVSDAVAATIKAAAGIEPGRKMTANFAVLLPEVATKPGVERWPVKTGQDPDRGQVGLNIIDSHDFGAGIVPATVEELISARRPTGMPDPRLDYKAFQSKRAPVVETTIWQLDATIIAMKLEADGDYHLVLQGASGEMMIGEVPTPTTEFVGDSPWLANFAAARQAVDAKFVSHLASHTFIMLGDKLVPSASLIDSAAAVTPSLEPFLLQAKGQMPSPPPFKTQLPPTAARVTGVGFFDKVHGQTGVSQSNGIELHPVLKIEWL